MLGLPLERERFERDHFSCTGIAVQPDVQWDSFLLDLESQKKIEKKKPKARDAHCTSDLTADDDYMEHRSSPTGKQRNTDYSAIELTV